MRIGRVVGRDVAVEDVGKNQRRWAVSCMRTELGSALTGTAGNRTSKETREGQRQAEVGVRSVVLPTMTVSTLAWISAQLPPRAAEDILALVWLCSKNRANPAAQLEKAQKGGELPAFLWPLRPQLTRLRPTASGHC